MNLSVEGLHVLAVPVWVSSGCSGFLPQPKNLMIRSGDYSNLPIDVGVNGYSSCAADW